MDTNSFARSLHTEALGTDRRYDVVVVGARVAGAATAMLLARRGFHVAVVDRSQYGSDTLSTHALMRPAVAQLHRWGLLGAVAASGAPPIRRTTFHYGDEVVPVDIKARDGFDAFYAPRRTVLDRIVVDAARAEGVEFHFGARVEGVLRDEHDRVAGVHGRDDRGAPFEIRAAITVGADGARSRIARDVEAPITRRASATTAVVYSYRAGLEVDGYEWWYQLGSGTGVIPTNDGLVCVFFGTTPDRFRERIAPAVADGFARELQRAAPELAARVLGSEVAAPYRTFPGLPGFLRRPAGPGWALVGDASYFKDPITAHGISDAFRDAELVSVAIAEVLHGSDPSAVFGAYEQVRDDLSTKMLDVSDAVARYDWDLPRLRALLMEAHEVMAHETRVIASWDEPSSVRAVA